MKAALAFAVEFWWLSLVAVIGVLWVSNAGLRADVAEADLVAATQLVMRESAARAHETELGKRESAHAEAQQKKDEEYATEKDNLARELRASADRARGLRGHLAAATASSGAGNPADPVACQRGFDRLETLGGLAGEGVELLVEGRGLLQQRDLDVRRLLDQVSMDRAAVGTQQGGDVPAVVP